MRLCRVIYAIAAAVTLMAVCSCSTRKNTAASRNYQAFITRYNVYFNGDEHYRETLRDMERSYQDDYTSLVPVHPAEMRGVAQAPQPTGNFDRSIEKAQPYSSIRSRSAQSANRANRRIRPTRHGSNATNTIRFSTTPG